MGNQLKVGDKAPDFTAIDKDLAPCSLFDIAKDKKVVLSVVPSIDTPVCQEQTKKFNKEATAKNDVVIITISMDLPFAQARFIETENITSTVLLSDYKSHDFASKYGLMIEELGLLSRAILVLDTDKTVKYVEYISEITNEPNYEEALKAL